MRFENWNEAEDFLKKFFYMPDSGLQLTPQPRQRIIETTQKATAGNTPVKSSVTFVGKSGTMTTTVTLVMTQSYIDGPIISAEVHTNMYASPGIGSYKQNDALSFANIATNGNIVYFQAQGTYTMGITVGGTTVGNPYQYDFTGFYDISTNVGSAGVKQVTTKQTPPPNQY